MQDLTVRDIRTRAVRSPMRRPLRTSVATVTMAPLVLIDVVADQGIVGHSYLFSYVDAVSSLIRQTIEMMRPTLIGAPLEPAKLQSRAAAPFHLLGTGGILGLCLSGLDVAHWDALAKSAGLPLARFLGGSPVPLRAYNSNGLGITSPEEAEAEAVELLEEGYAAIKVRLGYSEASQDLAVVRAIRRKVPDRTILMSDYNHCLSTAEAARRGQMLDDEGLWWIEEPTAFDDYAGNATVARSVKTPIQLGENFTTLREMQTALDHGACDLVMPDLERIGGVTGWLKAAALAETAGLPMSSHLFPEVSSHLLSVTPTRDWIEYVDWASPILAEPLVVTDGYVTAPERPGNGLAWNEDAVRRYAVD